MWSSVLVFLVTICSIYLHLPPLQVFLPGQSLSLLQNWLLHLRTRYTVTHVTDSTRAHVYLPRRRTQRCLPRQW